MTKKSIIPKINNLLIAVVLLSFLAMLVTAYLTYMHFDPGASSFCTINETLNCDIVNQSPWSIVDLGFVEIPVAIMGFVTYLILFVVPIGLIKKWNYQKIHKWLRPGIVLKLLKWLSIVGFVFSLYLTYIEAFVLQAWCLLCVAQQILIFVIMVLFLVMGGIVNNHKKSSEVCEFC
jgi:uncharacterized membrane protein